MSIKEDYLHVPRCRGPTAVAEWTKRHRALRDWMAANQTAPEIETLLSGISPSAYPRPSVEAACDDLVALRKLFADKQLKPTGSQFDIDKDMWNMNQEQMLMTCHMYYLWQSICIKEKDAFQSKEEGNEILCFRKYKDYLSWPLRRCK